MLFTMRNSSLFGLILPIILTMPCHATVIGENVVAEAAKVSADDGVEDTVAEEAEEKPVIEAENIDLKQVVTTPLEKEPAAETESQTASEAKQETELAIEPDSEPMTVAEEKKPEETKVSEDTSNTDPSINGSREPEEVLLPTDQDHIANKQLTLKLLNSEVKPGTSTRLAWEPSVSFMGISAPTAVLVVNGMRKGPTLCLTSAVHGDELNGIEIVRHILYNIEPGELAGAVIGVPIVNLQGFRRSSRYLPDRRDLNRYFPGNPNGSAASRIAYSFFEEVVSHCDFLIDLHTGSFKRTNLPQLRADLAYKKVAELADNMGSIVVVQSKGHSGSLRRAAVEYGVPSVTLEAGEPHILQKSAVNQGVKSIQNLMHALGMAKTLSFWELRKEPVYYKSRWVRSVNGGILFSDIRLGDHVSEGDVLGTVTDPITNLSTDIVSPYNGRIIGMALNQVMFPGFAAYHIGLRTPAERAAEGELSAGLEGKTDSEESEGIGDSMDETDPENPDQESESIMEMQILEDSE